MLDTPKTVLAINAGVVTLLAAMLPQEIAIQRGTARADATRLANLLAKQNDGTPMSRTELTHIARLQKKLRSGKK